MFMPDCERIAADHSASVNPSVAPAACSSALSSDQALVMEHMLSPVVSLSPAEKFRRPFVRWFRSGRSTWPRG